VKLAILLVSLIGFAFDLASADTSESEIATPTHTSFFNEKWLGAVVSIESAADGPLGTGFFVRTDKTDVILVSAAHVVRDRKGDLRKDLRYRRSDLDGTDALVSDLELTKADLGTWVFSNSSDLAARRFGWRVGVEGPPTVPDSHFMNMQLIDVGAPLLVLGFPTGLRSTTHKDPIARHGIVARTGSEGLMVEAFVFPGNSGGPVVYVPSLKVGDGGINSPLVNEEQLVGIVSSYVPYQEKAVSPQTGRTRVVFEENSGLSDVISVTELAKLLDDVLLKKKDVK